MAESGALVIFDSEKGGAGKSFIAMSFIEWVWHRLRRPVVVIEGNPHVPDVSRRFDGDLPVVKVNIRDDGWSRFADVVGEHPGAIVVANLPSDIAQAHPENRRAVLSGIRDLMGVRVILAWVLNNDPDGILAMKSVVARSAQPIEDLIVVPNLIHARYEQFTWLKSQTRAQFAKERLLEAVFPELWTEMAMIVRRAGVPFDAMREGVARDESGNDLPAGVRMTLHDWFRRTDLLWDGIAHEFEWALPPETDRESSGSLPSLPDLVGEEVV
jgi:hypothetical protein